MKRVWCSQGMVFSSSYGNWPNTIYHLSPQISSHFQNHQIFKSFSFFFPPFRWCKKDGAMLFSVVLSARVIGNEHQPEHKSFRLNIKKDFFTVQVLNTGTVHPQRLRTLLYLLGDFQKLYGHGPRRPALDGLA